MTDLSEIDRDYIVDIYYEPGEFWGINAPWVVCMVSFVKTGMTTLPRWW